MQRGLVISVLFCVGLWVVAMFDFNIVLVAVTSTTCFYFQFNQVCYFKINTITEIDSSTQLSTNKFHSVLTVQIGWPKNKDNELKVNIKIKIA